MLTEDLYAHAEERGDQTAVVYGDERLSYAELLERVERLAEGLAASGIEAGDPVALLLPNSTAFVVSFLAITGLGAVAVALNPQFKQEELGFYFRTSRVRAAIGDEAGTAVAERIVDGWDDSVRLVTTAPGRGRALSFEQLIEHHAGTRLDARKADEDFLYLYSSGSTGRPKRVARTHGQCWAEADSYMQTMAITPEDRLFCAIPLFHTYGLGNCLTTMARSGSTLVIMRDPNPFVLNRGRGGGGRGRPRGGR
jgi:long-chain acyl-CoA synthetase